MNQRIPIVTALKRGWVTLVVLVVLSAATITVWRLHGIFGSHQRTSAGAAVEEIVPVNPKRVTYQVFGPIGTVANINYMDANAQPQQVDMTTLPWSYTLTTKLRTVFANVVAQGDSDSIGCRIIVDGEVRDQQIANAAHAEIFCLVKSA